MRRASIAAVAALFGLIAVVGLGSAFAGALVGMQYKVNRECCRTPRVRNVWLSLQEVFGLTRFPSQIGQDKWVLETVYPGVGNGFFLDVGSGDGTYLSNTKALERRGWTGICIDPFPRHMEDRTCRMVKEIVFSEVGKRMTFQAAGELGGVVDTLGMWKDAEDVKNAQTVEFTTTTLAKILEEADAPRFINFVSLDIEGAELDALKAFPFGTYTVGSWAIEHNFEEPKRSQIRELLTSRGYTYSHGWEQDDFYVR